jgi:hypothetical protein
MQDSRDAANATERLELDIIIGRARRNNVKLALPVTTWPYDVKTLHTRIARLFLYRRDRRRQILDGYEDCVGLKDVRGLYSSEFRPPVRWMLEMNDRLTREVAQRGANRLRKMVLSCVRSMQTDIEAAGVDWGSEVRLIVKGSFGSLAMAAPKFPQLGSFSRSDFEVLSGLVRRTFGFSDMDLDLLVCPFLPSSRFMEVRQILVRCATACVARLKVRLDISGFGSTLAKEVSTHTNSTPSKRKSFVVQNAFACKTGEEMGPPPSRGLKCVSVLAEVGTFVGWKKNIRVPNGVAYVSTNELHFMNGVNEVHFTLCRCMLAFSKNDRKVHAEILDITIPYLTRSQLRKRWTQATIKIPSQEEFGPHALVLAPLEQLNTLCSTYTNSSQGHKLQKRAKRILVMLFLLVSLRGRVRTGSRLRQEALCLGANVDDLALLPVRIVKQGVSNRIVGNDWAKLAARVQNQVHNGHLFWQPHF